MPIIWIILISLSTSFAQDWKKWTIVKNCTLLDIAGNTSRNFPGTFCIFLPDGTYISSMEGKIRRLNLESETLWEVNEAIHHQNKLSLDGKRILGLGSDIFIDGKGEKHRDDSFLIMDLDGKILHKQVSSVILKMRKLDFLYWKGKEKIQGINSEIAHFNSISEIPPQTSKSGRPDWLKEGNIIVNGLRHGIFILSPDLKEVLHHQVFPQAFQHAVHDAQITPRGTFLYFNNLVANHTLSALSNAFGGSQEKLFSAIMEADVKDKIVNQFTATPQELFYSWACGGVQELDEDTWLFNHMLVGSYIYSKKQKKILMSTVQTNADWSKFSGIQEVKAFDLTKFLSHWK